MCTICSNTYKNHANYTVKTISSSISLALDHSVNQYSHYNEGSSLQEMFRGCVS